MKAYLPKILYFFSHSEKANFLICTSLLHWTLLIIYFGIANATTVFSSLLKIFFTVCFVRGNNTQRPVLFGHSRNSNQFTFPPDILPYDENNISPQLCIKYQLSFSFRSAPASIFESSMAKNSTWDCVLVLGLFFSITGLI